MVNKMINIRQALFSALRKNGLCILAIVVSIMFAHWLRVNRLDLVDAAESFIGFVLLLAVGASIEYARQRK
jgi:hypothetical protein